MTESEFIFAFNQPWRVARDAGEPFPSANRPAAVLICLNPTDDVSVLFTTRARHLKHHAGQISFPGGKMEDNDLHLIDTAEREAQEEIGLDRGLLTTIGAMPRYRTISGFAVTPIVSKLTEPVCIDKDLTIDPNEVEDVFSVPLAYLMDEKNYFIHYIQRGPIHFPVYYIPYENRTIWGATAGILAHLKDHINAASMQYQI